MTGRLNVDVSRSISELSTVTEQFMLKRKLYKTLFRGRGLDFEGYRMYGSDDDSSTIDWKASKRSNRLLVKEYTEEKDTQVMFAVDVGEHMIAGSTDKLKCEYAAEVVVALANLIVASGNKVGFILYSDKVRQVFFPERNQKAFQLLAELLSLSANYGGKSDIKVALNYISQYFSRSVTSVILVSDFLYVDPELESLIALVGSRFESLAFMIKDPLDNSLPNVSGEVIIEDPGTGEQLLIDPKLAGRKYENYSIQQEETVLNLFRKSMFSVLKLNTNQPFAIPLSQFLKERLEK